MSQHSKSATVLKRRKPEKPYPDYPLFPHDTGRWAKKVCGKIRFFGRWGHKSGAEIVPVDDLPASAAAALKEFERQWPYLQEGQEPPPADIDDGGCTMRSLCNEFLTSKRRRVDSGELTLHSFAGYQYACDTLIEFFGRTRRVDALRPSDFEAFRASLAKGCSVVTLKSKINRIRVVLMYASKNELIDRPVKFGEAFDRPSEKSLRKARNVAGKKMFEAEEIRRLLDAADEITKAMILVGVNCGFGNSDVSSLPQSAVDFDGGWINFPRPKTEVQRRIPLWKETVEALRIAVANRPAPVDPADANLCFLTERGTRYVRVQESNQRAGYHLTINALARRFELLLNRCKIERRRGVGFYTLRHVFETIGGDSRDQIAVDAIMGHADQTMAGVYRQHIEDDRLRAVVSHVRLWLFPPTRRAK